MSKATAGTQYTVVIGDTLTGIAQQAYGDGTQWRIIWRANQTVLRSDDPNLIFPGEVIYIPPNPLATTVVGTNPDDVTISGKEKDEITIKVDNVEILPQSARVIRTMDTCADGWTATVAWDTDNDELFKACQPGAYKKASVYLGGVLVVDGILYGQKFILGADNSTVELSGWSYTADIIDSVVRPPYEQNKITLEDRAKELIEPLGIGIVFEADDADEQFERVTCEADETIFSHLSDLAKQRKVLISSTRKGQSLFWRANTDGDPVGTILEEFPPYQNLEIAFNGRERYNVYTAIGQSPQKRGLKGKGKKFTAVAKDNSVPRSRFTAFNVTESTLGNIQGAADWARSKQLAEALSISFPVDSWYSPAENKLWQENTLITVQSKTMYVPDGFDFLIRAIEFNYDQDGTTAILGLIPPQAYTGEEIVEPWS
jgi:prophage tail gpP-like protein